MIAALILTVALIGRFPVSVPGTVPQPTLLASNLSLPGLASAATAASVPGEISASPLPLTVTAPATVQDEVVRAQDGTTSTVSALADQQRGAAVVSSDVVSAVRAERVPIFFEYEVQQGDTVTSIASRYHVAPNYIVWNNNDISDRDVLTVGTTLQVPSVEGIIHSVRYGESVSEIAARYGAEARDIIEFPANGLQDDPNRLRSDALILVPGGRKLAPVAPTLRPADPVPAPSGDADSWGWPITGMITSYYGPSHPLGIDIAAPWGSAVYSARGGTVSFAGGNPCCSYGLHVIIDHGGGYESLYAHLSSINVVRGQAVNKGDLVGAEGTTGHSTGPHVHFEIIRNGVPQDPIGGGFLP
ncbi:MAG: M23 family metallopeptidase [Chloroflexi bacterium]|nr:M23 family metallopeptidase [Chloroflexota bacterium]